MMNLEIRYQCVICSMISEYFQYFHMVQRKIGWRSVCVFFIFGSWEGIIILMGCYLLVITFLELGFS